MARYHLLQTRHGVEESSRSRSSSAQTRSSFVSLSHLISRVSTEFSKPLWRWLCSFLQCSPLLPASTGVLGIPQCCQAGMRFLGNTTSTWHPTQILTWSVFLNCIKSQNPTVSRLGSLPGYLSTYFSSTLIYRGKNICQLRFVFYCFYFFGNFVLQGKCPCTVVWRREVELFPI